MKKKTITVPSQPLEAFVFEGRIVDSRGRCCIPDWVMIALRRGQLYYTGLGDLHYYLPDGKSIIVQVRDYIVRDSKGVIFPIPRYVADNLGM